MQQFFYPNCGYKLTFLFYISAPLQGHDVLDNDYKIDILTTSFFLIFYISCVHFVMFIDMSLRNKLLNFGYYK